MTAARRELEALRPTIEPMLGASSGLALLLGQPALGDQLPALWTFADSASAAGEQVLAAANLALDSAENHGGVAGVLQIAPDLRSRLEAANGNLRKAQAARARLAGGVQLPGGAAKQINDMLAKWDELAPTLEPTLSDASRWLDVVSSGLGQSNPKTYLVLIQDSNELHATGGFITSAAQITVTNGKVTGLGSIVVTKAKYAEPNWDPNVGVTGTWVQPPEPLRRYMGLGNWTLCDANWWADFPTSARQAADFWHTEKGATVDGVVAADARGLAQILKITGPLTVTGQMVTAENLVQVTARYVFGGGGEHAWAQWAANQSAFTGQLAWGVIDALQGLPPQRWGEVRANLGEALRSHDLLFYSFDSSVSSLLRQLDADGALKGSTGDWLYLVEQNVSYTKASPFIWQDMAYTVTLGADALPVHAELNVGVMDDYSPEKALPEYPKGYYDGGQWNPTTRQVDYWQGYYGGYTRVYVPAGSRDLAASGFVSPADIGTETDRAVMGGYVGLRGGGRRQLHFAWTPGEQPGQAGEYKLLVQRQPGAIDQSLAVSVLLPPGYQATKIDPEPEPGDTHTVVRWLATLDQDRSFSLTLVPASGAVPATPAATTGPQPTATPGAPVDPVRLRMPQLAIDAPVVAVGQDDKGAMAVPQQAGDVAWYRLGPRPGEASNAVLAGHVDWYGKTGAFARLGEARPGDTIEVEDAKGQRYKYVVQETLTYPAANAPVSEIFGATAEPMLTLITCSGPYDAARGVYRDRFVVRARMEGH